MELRWILIILGALLGAGSFWNGIYAPGQQLVGTAVMAWAALRLGARAELARSELAGIALLLAGVAGSFAVPASQSNAAHGPFVVAGWLLAFMVGRQLSGGDRLVNGLRAILAATASLIIFGGVAALSYLPPHHSGRLASWLGYPIAVGALGLLGFAALLPELERERWWAVPLAFLGALGVWLSGSRGLWAAALPLACFLVWSAPRLLRQAWWPVAASLAAALWIGPAIAARTPLPAAVAMVVGCLTALAGARFRLAGIGAVLIAAIFAPGWGWFLGRATAIPLTEGSSIERLTFLKDGLRLAAGLPWGAGLKAWSALHLQGASYSYYSAEVHSAPLELTLAFGWLGGAGFCLLLGHYWYRLREAKGWSAERLALLAGLGALGVHALVDWELSYGLFMLPLWIGFGLIPPASVAARFRLPALAGAALAGVVVLGVGDLTVALAQRALQKGANQTAYSHAAMAVAVNPWNDLGHALHGQALERLGAPDAALLSYARARQSGPYEPWYAELHARALMAQGRWREASQAYQEFTRLWPWQVRAYEAALDAHIEMTMRARLDGESDLEAELTERARAILAALDRQKAREPAGAPRRAMQTESPALERARLFFEPGSD